MTRIRVTTVPAGEEDERMKKALKNLVLNGATIGSGGEFKVPRAELCRALNEAGRTEAAVYWRTQCEEIPFITLEAREAEVIASTTSS